MVKKVLLMALVLAGLAASRPAVVEACATELLECYEQAARIDSFWYRWAAGVDCELEFVSCTRVALVGA